MGSSLLLSAEIYFKSLEEVWKVTVKAKKVCIQKMNYLFDIKKGVT